MTRRKLLRFPLCIFRLYCVVGIVIKQKSRSGRVKMDEVRGNDCMTLKDEKEERKINCCPKESNAADWRKQPSACVRLRTAQPSMDCPVEVPRWFVRTSPPGMLGTASIRWQTSGRSSRRDRPSRSGPASQHMLCLRRGALPVEACRLYRYSSGTAPRWPGDAGRGGHSACRKPT
jgi:hypothetical protein